MGKIKAANERRRRRLRDAPLRLSFVLYMVVTAITATAVCALIINGLDNTRIELYYKYREMAEVIPVPEDGHVEYGYTDDAEVVMQVCGNILSNSARYARRRVEIELLLVNGALRVAVTDDGGGFTREGLEKAASPFYKGEGSGSEHLGLGLNICDILCRRHGGRLVIENAGAGARVTAVFGVE